ncbi:MAG TPA: hypothetical protein VJL59_14705 [Anaerolineales bacterium]|nr:hypothetical protein [Anaerolineales bacterium]
MNLRQSTRDIVKLVEEQTGFPVQVLEDSKLPTMATVRIARGNLPAHIITIKPVPGEQPDYLIAYQCGFILRHFANPPQLRFEVGSTQQGRDEVQKAVMAPGGPAQRYHLNSVQASQLQAQLLGGLIIHLRSVPIGMRVGQWIRQEYPEFDELQRAQVLRELAQNREVLRREIKEMTPEQVYRPTLAINAAFAFFWTKQYGDPDLQAGFQSGRSERDGHALLNIWQETSAEPEYDRVLVDAWARKLDLADWYEWAPYQPPA